MPKFFRVTVLLSFIALALSFSSCKKDEKTSNSTTPVNPSPTPVTGKLKLSFKNVVDSFDLSLGNTYLTTLGESYTISKFNYYISNVSLIKEDNSLLEIKNVYRIVKQNDDTSRVITLSNVPSGNYKGIQLMLGVDSASNNSGAHSGGLDFDYASDMFWGWNQGYIFLKLEGSAPTSTLTNSKIEYHIGGYGGILKAQRIYTINFTSVFAKVSESVTPEVMLKVNANELFTSPQSISFATKPQQTTLGIGAKQIADNYADMITLNKVVN